MTTFKTRHFTVGDGQPTYFVADISANHDGQLDRAKLLIRLCAEAGANAAKFQNFRAPEIVSDRGFKDLGSQQSHQSKWKKSVFEVYKDASLPWEWTEELKQECNRCGIDYFSAPYDFAAVDMLDPHMELYKIGSGDITWIGMIEKIASKNKPILLATGASTMEEVRRAASAALAINPILVLMQCNTNYTASLENFKHIHLNALKTYRKEFPTAILGLSDHTPGHATTLGAVALGARVIEKHFTDDNHRIGPDHPFSMNPVSWHEMVNRTRELELALGSDQKFVADNERETVVLQRRCLRAARDLAPGASITRSDVHILRPAPGDGLAPYELESITGKTLKQAKLAGQHFVWADFQ